MDDMKCCNICGTLTIDGDISSTLLIDDDIAASMSVGTVIIRDGTNDYNELINHPSIEGIELVGDRLLSEFGETPLSNVEIKSIFDRVFRKD